MSANSKNSREGQTGVLNRSELVLITILTFDLWPWKPFQQWPLTMMNICDKLQWNPPSPTKYRNVESCEKISWPGFDLDLWPLILKIFSALGTQTLNICAKVHWIRPRNKEIICRTESVLTDGWTTHEEHTDGQTAGGQPQNISLLPIVGGVG